MIYTLVWSTQIMADLHGLELSAAVHVTNNIMMLARDPYPVAGMSTVTTAHGNELYALHATDHVVVYDIVEPSTVHLLGVTPAVSTTRE